MEKIKKVKTVFERSYRPVVIWFNDLAEIIESMKQYASNLDIRTEDYRYESLEELKEHIGSQTPSALRLSSANLSDTPSISVSMNRMEVKLWVFDPHGSHVAERAFCEIDDIIIRCQRRFSRLYSPWAFILAVAILPISIGYFREHNNVEALRVLFTIEAITTLWCLWIGFIMIRRTTVINLQRRSEVRPFFERNKDQLLLALISAIIGGCITLAGVMVKENVYPSAPIGSISTPR